MYAKFRSIEEKLLTVSEKQFVTLSKLLNPDSAEHIAIHVRATS